MIIFGLIIIIKKKIKKEKTKKGKIVDSIICEGWYWSITQNHHFGYLKIEDDGPYFEKTHS